MFAPCPCKVFCTEYSQGSGIWKLTLVDSGREHSASDALLAAICLHVATGNVLAETGHGELRPWLYPQQYSIAYKINYIESMVESKTKW